MSATQSVQRPPTPYEAIGGSEPIARMVDRFYDLMDSDPAYIELRAMHAQDLGPMRQSLAEFLTAWMGGPRNWFVNRPGICIMSAHRALPGMADLTARQWIDAMRRAAEQTLAGEEEFIASMIEGLERIARVMAANAEPPASPSG